LIYLKGYDTASVNYFKRFVDINEIKITLLNNKKQGV